MAGAETDTHQHLRAWRRRRNKTLEKVSELIGSKVNTISGWENGKRRLNLDDLSRLAAIYEVTAADLLQSPEACDQRQSAGRLVGVASRLTPEQAAHLMWLAEQMIPPHLLSEPGPAKASNPSARHLPRPLGVDSPSPPFSGGSVAKPRLAVGSARTRT